MRLLPPQTLPPTATLERAHVPRPSGGRYGYQEYRACLRWEFGFTCAFCLLHEADLTEHGVEGTALTSVEHFVPAGDPEPTNRYANCFYACRFCNVSRGSAPLTDRQGRQLLNPCAAVWGERFSLSADDRLVPRGDDRDAQYTETVYALNEPRKIAMRQSRRERIGEWLQLFTEGPALEAQLLERAASAFPAASAQRNLRAAQQLRSCLQAALRDLRRYAAIPADADPVCRCEPQSTFELPAWLRSQTVELPGDEPQPL